MVWHQYQRYYDSIRHFQTFLGQLWFINIFLFRLFVMSVLGEQLFNDDQEEFKCDTLLPGCKQVCFNDFSPIALFRFWGMQILLCMTPLIGFQFYAISIVEKAAKNKIKSNRKLIDYLHVLKRHEKKFKKFVKKDLEKDKFHRDKSQASKKQFSQEKPIQAFDNFAASGKFPPPPVSHTSSNFTQSTGVHSTSIHMISPAESGKNSNLNLRHRTEHRRNQVMQDTTSSDLSSCTTDSRTICSDKDIAIKHDSFEFFYWLELGIVLIVVEIKNI